MKSPVRGRALPAALLLGLAWPAASLAEAPLVLTDILPVHGIAARVMDGVGAPGLLVPPGASPHGYALRPSEARALQEADVVFWVGEDLEPWLEESIASLPRHATIVELSALDGLTLLPYREDAEFMDGHDHDHGQDQDHGSDDHAAHAEPDHDHPARDDAAHDDEHDHDHAAAEPDPGHDHDGMDQHIWLDPQNAIVIAAAMADTLAERDPGNAPLYDANAVAFAEEIASLEAEVAARLAPAEGKRFVVFHDAYHYFEARFGFEASGSIAFSDASAPSAERIREVREAIAAREVACVFAEPQFNADLTRTVIEGTGARAGTLDPLGTHLEPGPGFYPALMLDLGDRLAGCLTEN